VRWLTEVTLAIEVSRRALLFARILREFATIRG
jgi:hypothetical protein